MVGRSLGHYDILEPLGSGGMGDVYRAHDTTLDRDVAIKVLPDGLSDDPDRLARLKREAHLLAALNHPNVATIHGFEESDGTRFLVMELVKGESLEQRLAGGGVPVDEALDICRQIAEALEAAHEEGIIHRDLKPANVLITPEGRAKVLDFGLAKTVERVDSDTDMSRSPTITIAGTEAGVILGTAPYMSPEQVRGKPLDKRADIWAFGCVLYETLSGGRAFNRETVADTLAAILDVEPPWDALPTATPLVIRSLLHRCLRKDPRRRLHDIADARIEIEEAGEPAELLPGVVGVAGRTPLWRRPLAWAVAGTAVGAVVAGLAIWGLLRPTAPEPTYAVIPLEGDLRLWGGTISEAGQGGRPSRTAFALTADGRTIVYAATDGSAPQLYLRRLGDPQAIPIAGTQGGSSPFLSPDGQHLGFVAGSDIRVVPVSGGEPRTILANAPLTYDGGNGVSWADDSIVFSGEGGIFRVPAAGGSPEQLTEVRRDRDELRHLLPQMLPGGAGLLYTVQYDWELVWETAEIVASPIGGEPIVLARGTDARYSPTGHVVFARQGVLMAAGFDPVQLELTGEEVRVFGDVMHAVNTTNNRVSTGASQFTFSSSGSLVYATGGTHPYAHRPLVWIDRGGNVEPIPVPAGEYRFFYPRISPDGRWVACNGPSRPDVDIMVFDLATGAKKHLELPGLQEMPVWSPDGTRLAFSSQHEGAASNLYWITVDDLSGDPHRITESDRSQWLADWSVDDMLAFVQDGDIWIVDAAGATEPQSFVGHDATQGWPAFSPDGKWLAYASSESGRSEIYVRPYPGPEPAFPVTREGGRDPAWARDGSELFYSALSSTGRKLMAVEVERGSEFKYGPALGLFDGRIVNTVFSRSYDVAEDGRFVSLQGWSHPPQPVTELLLVLNWFEELKERVPTGR